MFSPWELNSTRIERGSIVANPKGPPNGHGPHCKWAKHIQIAVTIYITVETHTIIYLKGKKGNGLALCTYKSLHKLTICIYNHIFRISSFLRKWYKSE